MNNLISYKNTIWHHQLSSALADYNVECHFFLKDNFQLIAVNQNLVIHAVNLDNDFHPDRLINLQGEYVEQNIKLIHLWEDVWESKPKQVLSRIASILGLNIRIHGRKTKVFKITKPIAQDFLNENHLQGFVSSRYKFGLFEKTDLVAVATFSALRKMNYEPDYKSAELIRFAVKAGYSVTGGLSKFLVHFHEEYLPNDIMTYADRDWSAGEAYLKLKFIQTDLLQPQFFNLSENGNRILTKEHLPDTKGVFNTGSVKYILKF